MKNKILTFIVLGATAWAGTINDIYITKYNLDKCIIYNFNSDFAKDFKNKFHGQMPPASNNKETYSLMAKEYTRMFNTCGKEFYSFSDAEIAFNNEFYKNSVSKKMNKEVALERAINFFYLRTYCLLIYKVNY
jgi:hypothetical protein